MPERYDAFISYQSADLAHAEFVYGKLTAAGFKVWMERVRLEPGCDWYREIEAGCEASRIVLPVFTSSALACPMPTTVRARCWSLAAR